MNMYSIRILFICTFFLFSLHLYSQSLWVESNPYSAGQNVKVGTIVKIVLKDSLKTEYFYESNKDDTHTIKSFPDKKFNPEMIPYTSDRSIAKKSNGKSKSKGSVVGVVSAVVTEIDNATGNLTIEGTRESLFDDQMYILKVSGLVAPLDLREDRSITSELIANFKLEFQGSPVKSVIHDPDVQMNKITNPDGTTIEKGELSDADKQKILFKYLKRMLGESE